MSRTRALTVRLVVLFLASLSAASSFGATLFVDEFDGPNLNPVWQATLPSALWRFDAGIAFYQGASGFTFQSLNGRTVIRLHNVLDNAQRKGWSTARTFPTDAPVIYEARFNTLVQSSATAIDELLEIWLLDAAHADSYDIVALTAPGFGTQRVFTSSSSITGAGLDTPFDFHNNTWYRMVIRGSREQTVRASIYNDAGTVELIGVDLGHTLRSYPSGFRLGISQSMGQPQSPFPTDVALDSVKLTATPLDDADGDGVPDRSDACPQSDLSATIVIDKCDSGVSNPVFPTGCTIADFIAACGDRTAQPGRFTGCVSRVTSSLKTARIISGRQTGSIQTCAVATQ